MRPRLLSLIIFLLMMVNTTTTWSAEGDATKRVIVIVQGTQTLKALTEQMRKNAHVDLYVDRRFQDVEVFVSPGQYQFSELLELIRSAAHLEERKVGNLLFLAPPLPKKVLPHYGGDERERKLLAQIAQLLQDGIDVIPLGKDDAPFPKVIPPQTRDWSFDQLSVVQQRYIEAYLKRHDPDFSRFDALKVSKLKLIPYFSLEIHTYNFFQTIPLGSDYEYIRIF